MATLRELGSVSAGVREERDFLDGACAVLAENPYSLPFSMVYLLDEDGEARLDCSAGIKSGHPAAPPSIDPRRPDSLWPMAELGGALGASTLVTGTLARFGSTYLLTLQLVDVRAADGRAAQSYVDRLSIGTSMDAARTLAQRYCGDDVISR